MLRDQLTWSQVALKDDRIRSFVVGNQLAVIVIPPNQIDPDKPAVFVFPELLVCLRCGTTQFVIPETELCLIAISDASTAG